MDFERFPESLAKLGAVFRETARRLGSGQREPLLTKAEKLLADELSSVHHYNPWFIPQFTRYATAAWGNTLTGEKVHRWLDHYRNMAGTQTGTKKIGIVMAGNLPFVGLHDLLCVIASGNIALVRLSSSDDRLIPAVAGILSEVDPSLKERFIFTKEVLRDFDAIIATGSNNTSRYFEYYFRKFPSVIRKNRNGVAVITGGEDNGWLRNLADDLFLYFGLGCRNVSKLYLPEGYDPNSLFSQLNEYEFLIRHNKYLNNYEYQKSLLLISRRAFFDNGFLILRQDPSIPSPVAVIHYEHYRDLDELNDQLLLHSVDIQCIVSKDPLYAGSIQAGTSQRPELWEYADGVDTMEFLLDLR